MSVLAGGMIAVLLGAGGMHALWGLGICWPIRDERRLAQAVVGGKGVTRMPPGWMAFGVTGLTVLGALWTCFLAGWIGAPIWLMRLGGWTMCAILLLRGTSTYLRGWLPWPVEPVFDHLDRVYFAPLILFLGLGTLALLLM